MRCAVFDCKNESRSKNRDVQIRFHTFPKDKLLSKQWTIACCRADKFNLKNARICSKHFKAEDYKRNLQQELLQYISKQGPKLKADAVPSLFLPKSKAVKPPGNRDERMRKRNNARTVKEIIDSKSQTWAKMCNRLDLLESKTSFHNIRICSQHFEETMFKVGKRNLLRPTAYPTIFPIQFDCMESTDCNPGNLDDPLKLHTEILKLYKCKICGKEFGRKNILNFHKKTHQSSEKTYDCNLCNNGYNAKHLTDCELEDNLCIHNKVGENHFMESNETVQPAETNHGGSVCEICRADCGAEGLDVHMSTHDVKPFKCECFMVFFSESEYMKHIKDDCEVVKSGLKDVKHFKVENVVKEELEIGFEGVKQEYDDG